MRTLDDLLDSKDPAIHLLRDWVRDAEVPVELLPPSTERVSVLLSTQVTKHSILGALAYETGGLLVDGGWLRFLGSGHERLARTLPGWNAERAASGFYLLGDDAAGGFFALNGGALGPDRRSVQYWAPDSLLWSSVELGFADLVAALLSSRLSAFYQDLRWPTWRADTTTLPSDRCMAFYPFLWTREGSLEGSHRASVPVGEAFEMKRDLATQIDGAAW